MITSGNVTAEAIYAPLSFDAVVSEAGGITAGKAVYVSGGSGGVPTVSLADNTVHTKTHFAGLAAESGANGATIRIVHKGVVSNIDTSSYTAGNRLHLITAGNYQTGIPQGGHIHVGFVLVSHATAGKIYATTNEYTHDMRGPDDEDIEIAVGSNDGTRKVSFQKKDGTEVLSIDGMGNMNFNSGTMYVDGTSGYIGVGTTTPTVPFHAAISGSGTAFLLEGDEQQTPKLTFKSTALGFTSQSSISYDSNNVWWQFDDGALKLTNGYSFQIGAMASGWITNTSGVWTYYGRDELTLQTKTDNTKFVSVPYGNFRINRDNGGVLFGTGEDAKIYYDGSDLIIDPDVVGSGKTKVNGSLQATDYYSGDGTQGITNNTSYWLCTAANCSTTCQATIKDGLITGCP